MCFFKGLVCVFVYFCVNLDHFGFMLLVLLGLVSLVPSGKNISKMTLFCVEGDVKLSFFHSGRFLYSGTLQILFDMLWLSAELGRESGSKQSTES